VIIGALSTIVRPQPGVFSGSPKEFDIVVSDLRLPDEAGSAHESMDGGIRVLARARELGLTTILLTAASIIDDDFRPDLLIQKPVFFEQLISRIRDAVEGRLNQDEGQDTPGSHTTQIGPFLKDVPEPVRRVVECVLHDLRGNLALSASDLKDLCDLLRKGDAADIEEWVHRLPALSKEAICYTRLLYDTLIGSEVEIRTIDARLAVQEGVAMAERFRQEGTVSNCTLPKKRINVRSDHNLLAHVVMNLVRNAFEAAGPDGIVQVSCKKTTAQVEFLVSNTGAGIAKPGNIFDWGWSTKGPDHTGIGLAFASTIMKSMGGSIQYKSKQTFGSRSFENTFVLQLPIVRSET
jgi:signal transduction histidine kinase